MYKKIQIYSFSKLSPDCSRTYQSIYIQSFLIDKSSFNLNSQNIFSNNKKLFMSLQKLILNSILK